MTVVCIKNCADVSLLMQGVSEWIQCGRPAMRIFEFHGMTVIRRILQRGILLVAQTHGQVAHAKAMAFANGLGSVTHQAKPRSGLPVRHGRVLKYRTHLSLVGDSLGRRDGLGPFSIKDFGRRIDRGIGGRSANHPQRLRHHVASRAPFGLGRPSILIGGSMRCGASGDAGSKIRAHPLGAWI